MIVYHHRQNSIEAEQHRGYSRALWVVGPPRAAAAAAYCALYYYHSTSRSRTSLVLARVVKYCG